MANVKIKLDTNQTVLLDDPHKFWMITSGEVDVFFVDTDAEGNYLSGLKYLYSAKKGELIFSLLTKPKASGFKMLIKSQQANLVEVNKNKLLEIDHFVLKMLVEKWVSKTASVICRGNPPRVHTTLDKEKEITLTKGTIAYPSRRVVWGLVTEGEVGKYGLEQGGSKKKVNSFFPISHHLWVQVLSEEAHLRILTTTEALEDEIFFLLSLNKLQEHLYQRMVGNIEADIEQEEERIAEKVNVENSQLRDNLQRICNIVNTKRGTQNILSPIANPQVRNDLFTACQLIGEAVNFQFDTPKYLETYTHSTSNQLYAIAQASKVRVRKIILRSTWWKEENGHLLAFMRDSHEPVALIQKTPKVYVLKNPTTGEETVVNYKVAAQLEPISYMFFYGFEEQMTSVKKILNFALQGIKGDASNLILAALAGSVIGLLVPVLSGIMFDDVIPSADKSLHKEVFLVLIMIAVITAGLQLVQSVLQLRVESKSSVNVQSGVMDHLLRLPVGFYKRYSAGDLTNRALSINKIRQILSNTVLTAVLSGAFSFVNLILLFYYESSMAWVGLGLAVAAIAFISMVGWMKLKYDRQISDVKGDLQGFLFEFLSGITKIRNTAAERRVFTLWSTKFSRLKQLGFNSGTYQNLVETFNSSYPLFANVFFFGFIYYTVSNSTSLTTMISVGAFMAFISAFNQFLRDALRMSLTLVSSLNVVTLYERVKPILDEVPESNTDSTDPGELSGDIEVNSASFRYFEEQPLILKDVSFQVKPGEMVAFVGPSGSGKSTIMRLLLGFEEPESGSIYYDGEAFDSMNKDLVRKQIGVVLQNGALMAGSIYQNIVGNSELTLEEAWEAARLAGMEDDIKQMPMEMHTVISQGAGTFSGGQRQRLMIARAIVHKPRLVFMDEATSALDNRTQSIVSESLEKLQATRIVIAHRLSTIEKADRIYVLDKGEIVEFGSFEELMAKDGTFSKMANRQMA